MALHPEYRGGAAPASKGGRIHDRRALTATVLALLLLAGVKSAPGSAAQPLSFPGLDGLSVPAEYYRPPVPSSSGVLLLPAAGGGASAWAPLADSLAARGYHVLVAHLPSGERAVAETPRRGRNAISWKDEPWRDALAAVRLLRQTAGDSLARLIWGGAESGASAAVVAASRDVRPPAALVLLSPEPELSGIPIAPILAGLGRPVLVVAGRDDAVSGDAARRIYMSAAPACELWECDSAWRGEQLLRVLPLLAGDLVEWIGGPSGGAHAGFSGRGAAGMPGGPR